MSEYRRQKGIKLLRVAVSLLTAVFICTIPAFAKEKPTKPPPLKITHPFSSKFISQDVPPVMEPAKIYTVSITFKNTGKVPWKAGIFALSSQNPAGNNIWSIRQVELLPSDFIRPGQNKTFTFKVTAPLQAGVYNFQWQMKAKPYGYFGEKSVNLKLKVNSPPNLAPIDDKSTYEHKPIQFEIQANDPDNDTLTYSASNLPPGATFDNSTHTFSWNPQHGQKGTYPDVRFEASDGITTASTSVSMTVLKTVIFGTIYEKNQQGETVPLEGVNIDILDMFRTTIIASGITNETGHFDVFYETWTDGTYIIRASKPGYRTYEGAATLRGNSMMPFSVTLVENVPPDCRWINVRAYGARGDGITDDWTAIKRAVTAIPRNGGVLYFPPGVYISSGPIYIANKTNFALLGYGATIRISTSQPYLKDLADFPIAYDGSGTTREFSVLEIFNCSDWYLTGLLLDGNYRNRGASDLEHSHGIHLAGCHRFTVESVEAQYCQGDGIELTAMNNTNFPTATTSASNCSEFTLRDIKAHNIARNSISVVGARNGIIDGLIDYDIGTDLDNAASMGPWSGIHFEVDESEKDYEVSERITATNLNMRNHRPSSLPNGGNGGAVRFANRSRYCTVSNFLYEQDTPNTELQYIARVGPNSSHITFSNGMILVKNAAAWDPNRTIHCYGIYLDGRNKNGDFPHDVTIDRVTIDGPTIGIRVSAACKNIRIANNIVRNCYRSTLMLIGECYATGNYLVDVTGGADGRFIEVQTGESGDIISCENNILVNNLTPGAAYYFAVSATARFIANYNKCYGLSGTSFNIFDADPISFLENKFGDNAYGFSGTFTWPVGSSSATVSNTNVTPYTRVLIFPSDASAGELVRNHGVYVSTISNYSSFTISSSDGLVTEGGTFSYTLR